MSRRDLVKLKEEFFEKRQELLKGKVSRFERKFFDKVFDDFISKLNTSGGRVEFSARNINLTSAIDKVYNDLRPEYEKIIKSFSSDLVQIGKFNASYFSVVDERAGRVKDLVNKSVSRVVGVNADGSLVRNGFLDRFAKDTSVLNEVKQSVINSISSGRSFSELKEDMERMVQGNEELQGGFQQYFRNYAYDTYQKTDRVYQEAYATELELTAFIYEGGTMDSTRPFCDFCNGKVFLKEEFQELTRDKVPNFINWNGSFKEAVSGIPVQGWKPLTDMGGYGCRHMKNYISSALAVRMRSDLEIKDGKLIKI